MEAKASAKYIRGSAQKARLVIDMIRGKRVNQALATLQFTNKRATNPIEACVRSAIANATELAEKENVAVDPDDLWIKEAFVDKGPTKGRMRTRPAPQGRAYRERRHFCHITVMLSSDEMPEKKSNGKGASRLAARQGGRKLEDKMATRKDEQAGSSTSRAEATPTMTPETPTGMVAEDMTTAPAAPLSGTPTMVESPVQPTAQEIAPDTTNETREER